VKGDQGPGVLRGAGTTIGKRSRVELGRAEDLQQAGCFFPTEREGPPYKNQKTKEGALHRHRGEKGGKTFVSKGDTSSYTQKNLGGTSLWELHP